MNPLRLHNSNGEVLHVGSIKLKLGSALRTALALVLTRKQMYL
jgi:hypothetical protein